MVKCSFSTDGENWKLLGDKAEDAIHKPSHYQGRYGMEAIDVVKNFGACPEYEEGFYWGNAIKYMLRWHSKNGIEDLKKARQNLDWLIEKLEEK
ncbi:DUF3310 domain-containing protein [uncultured Streptococcus sp.]|uniref:DUF3310 domain-containing protein n=1 Tax=uncultured Streptococcus sp. TaxID=83427 RepID=UPI0027DCB55F|nr:DUF3310 domain-containing protein [uncultured Streptococcus sp.]